jgi:release factor glutamine methyltransferase
MMTTTQRIKVFLLVYLCSLILPSASFADPGDYHPSRFKFSIPGIEQENPPSYQHLINSRVFWIFPDVIRATTETAQFLQYMRIRPGEDVLEIGTGSGVLAIHAAESANHVVATDISQAAVENARYNAKVYGLEKKVDVRLGDLFSPIARDEKFDVILFNVGDPATENQQDFWNLHERFITDAGKFLKPGGRIYLHGGFIDKVPRTRKLAETNGLKIFEMHMWTSNKASAEPILFVLTQQDPS